MLSVNFDNLIREEVDDSYINAWNNWKRLQSWDKKYSDLDRPLLVFLSNMPTKLNSICNLCKIPKAHDEYQVECLIKFYTMQQIPDSECPVEVAIKEVYEETGIQCEPLSLISVVDGMRQGFTQIPLYSMVFHCRAIGGKLDRHLLETSDAGWFARDSLPVPLAGLERWVDSAFAAIDGIKQDVTFDPPRSLPWNEK